MRDKDSGIYATDGRPFDYPLTAVDSRRWQRLGELSIEEAAFVVAGFEPPPIEVIRFKPIPYQERPGETWARPTEYDDFVCAAERALQREQMTGRTDIHKMLTVRLVEFPTILQWARERGFTVASVWEHVAKPASVSEVRERLTIDVPAPVVTERTSNAPAWKVSKPKRNHGYTEPLYRLLSAAHQQCKPRPNARDVLDAWRAKPPGEIAKVLTDSMDYYDNKDGTKTANIEAIQEAINRMTKPR